MLVAFLGVIALAWRRSRKDPVERLWIPIAVATLPMAIAWVATKDDQRATEFREAIVISAAAGAGPQASQLAIPIFTLPSTLAWVRYHHAKRDGHG